MDPLAVLAVATGAPRPKRILQAIGRAGDAIEGNFGRKLDGIWIRSRALFDTAMLILSLSEEPEPPSLSPGPLGLGVWVGSRRLCRHAPAEGQALGFKVLRFASGEGA